MVQYQKRALPVGHVPNSHSTSRIGTNALKIVLKVAVCWKM